MSLHCGQKEERENMESEAIEKHWIQLFDLNIMGVSVK